MLIYMGTDEIGCQKAFDGILIYFIFTRIIFHIGEFAFFIAFFPVYVIIYLLLPLICLCIPSKRPKPKPRQNYEQFDLLENNPPLDLLEPYDI